MAGDITASAAWACSTGRASPPRSPRSAPRRVSTTSACRTTWVWRVNVGGHAQRAALRRGCPGLRRHQYVSTCYVSGRHCGLFHETDLDVGQSFNNHYEETKFLAEVEVAEARDGACRRRCTGRPSWSAIPHTGDTQKFDGPYFLLQWLLRQPEGCRPRAARRRPDHGAVQHGAVGLRDRRHRPPVGPRGASAGRTYQLADPRPLTVDELLSEMCRATGRRGVRVPLPRSLTTWALRHIDALSRYVGIPADAVEYFVHPTHYDTAGTDRDLAGAAWPARRSRTTCPPSCGSWSSTGTRTSA